MQKVLLSIILALVMALALVGMKRAFSPAGSTQGAVLVAEGTAPAPGYSF
jgi:hypothetical protein